VFHPRLARVLREAGWLLLLAAALYLALALATYHRSDPGPFFSGTGDAVANRAGIAGAWISEALLYLFGLSAWWWVALALHGVLRLYRRVESWQILNRRTLAVSLVGFALLLAASSALEALRLYSLPRPCRTRPAACSARVLASFTAARSASPAARCC
jgi:S-DNA-T family DNA segregation ATPase FtsK/SpoIIIE